MVSLTHAATALVALVFGMDSPNSNTAVAFVPSRSSVGHSRAAERFTSSFSPTQTLPASGQGKNVAFLTPSRRGSSSNTMRMLVQPGGRDALVELISSDSPYTKTVRKTPKPLRKIASLASIPAAAITGFALTPSRRLVAHGVGGALAGVAGVLTKSRLDVENVAAAKPALAQLLLDHDLKDAELPDLVQQLKSDFSVSDDDFMDVCEDVYRRYLMAMVKNPQTKTSEIGEVTTLASVLALDNVAIGEAHAAAASEVYRKTTTWTPEEELDDPEHPDRMSLDKLLFLTERALRHNGETPEAFRFEFSRVCKSFNVTAATGLRRVANVAEPFYERALETTRVKLDTGAVSPDMLSRARATLGIDERVCHDMHLSTYGDEVRSLLGLETEGADPAECQFPDGASERLENLRSVLGITDEDAAYEASVEVTPLFQATLGAILNDATAYAAGNTTEKPDFAALWKTIDQRQKDLCLSDEAMIPLIDGGVVQALGRPLEEASMFATVNNEPSVYGKMMEAVAAKDAINELLSQSSVEEVSSGMTRYYDTNSRQACFAFMRQDIRKKMYQMTLSRALKIAAGDSDSPALTDETEEKLKEAQHVLGVYDEVADDVKTIVCGPIVDKALKIAADEITGEDSTPELLENFKTKNDELIASLRVPEELVQRYGLGIYKKYLSFVKKNTPSGIPSNEFAEKLSALLELLHLKEEDVSDMHVAIFGPTYKRSVLEAMGSTGIIVPEYRDALEKLRIRLGVGPDDASRLFKDAVSEKVIPMVKRIEAEMERTLLSKQQLAQKRGKDMGEDVFRGGKGATGDLGIGTQGNVMGDIMTLVDFYNENDLPQEKEVGTKKVEKKVPSDEEGGEEKTVTEEEPIFETVYPVTALGAKAIEPEMAEAMYRQFLVGSFTTQGPKAARYEKAAPTFGGILGLSTQGMAEISGSVGGTVYENYIENSLKTKSSLDQQDMMFLANIQTKLNLPSEKAEEMMLEAQKKVLQAQGQLLFQAESVFAHEVKSFREKCNGMGLDITEDLGFLKGQLKQLFAMEVSDDIMKGQLTIENADYLAEIQESLGLTPEECESTLEGLVKKRTSYSYEMIDKELMRGRQATAIEHIRNLLKFSAFLEGDIDLKPKEARANEIVGIFAASDFGNTPSKEVETQVELLKASLGVK